LRLFTAKTETICRRESKIGGQRTINYVIEQSGYLVRGGTIADATIMNAPSSPRAHTAGFFPDIGAEKRLRLTLWSESV